MSEAAAKALGYFCQGMDSDNQWRKAVDVLRDMDEKGRAQTWVIMASRKPEMGVVELSKYKAAFKRAMREVEEERGGSTEIVMYGPSATVPVGVDNGFVQKTLERSIALCHVFNAALDEIVNARKMVQESMSGALPSDVERVIKSLNGAGSSVVGGFGSPRPFSAGEQFTGHNNDRVLESQQKLTEKLSAAVDELIEQGKASANAVDKNRWIGEEIKSTRSELKELSDAVRALTSADNLLKSENTELSNAIQSISSKLDTHINTLQRDLNSSTEAARQSTSDQINALSAQLATAIHDSPGLAAVRGEVAALAARMGGVGDAVKGVNEEVQKLKNAVEELKISESVIALGRITAELTSMKDVIETFRTSELKAQFNSKEMKQKIESIEAKISEQGEKINIIALNSEMKEAVDSLAGKVAVCAETMERNDESSRALMVEHSNLHLQLAEGQNTKIDEIRSMLGNMEGEVDKKLLKKMDRDDAVTLKLEIRTDINTAMEKNSERLHQLHMQDASKIQAMESRVGGFEARITNTEGKISEMENMIKKGAEDREGMLKTLETSRGEIQQVRNLISSQDTIIAAKNASISRQISALEDQLSGLVISSEGSVPQKSSSEDAQPHAMKKEKTLPPVTKQSSVEGGRAGKASRNFNDVPGTDLEKQPEVPDELRNQVAEQRKREKEQISRRREELSRRQEKEKSSGDGPKDPRTKPQKSSGNGAKETKPLANGLSERSNLEDSFNRSRSQSPSTHWRYTSPSPGFENRIHADINLEPEELSQTNAPSSGFPRPTTMLEYLSRQFGQ